jgi:hypothetical protein
VHHDVSKMMHARSLHARISDRFERRHQHRWIHVSLCASIHRAANIFGHGKPRNQAGERAGAGRVIASAYSAVQQRCATPDAREHAHAPHETLRVSCDTAAARNRDELPSRAAGRGAEPRRTAEPCRWPWRGTETNCRAVPLAASRWRRGGAVAGTKVPSHVRRRHEPCRACRGPRTAIAPCRHVRIRSRRAVRSDPGPQ